LALVALAGCKSSATEPELQPLDETDYAFVLFGEAGMALEGMLGSQSAKPFDGSTAGVERLPADLRLTEAQRTAIAALRAEFREVNRDRIAALRATLERARDARAEGDSQEEIRAIRMEAMAIARSMRGAVLLLHVNIRNILTPEQRAWLRANAPSGS
jgi:Spy/CpxP family protein refolding chaperone